MLGARPSGHSKARQALSSVEVDFIENPYKMAEGADALVLATEWEEYAP